MLIFATGQWLRLVPVTWGVFPAALSTALQYASLNFPVDESWTRYNGLQQLSYFITVFIAAPVSIATGLMQSPAISNRLGLLGTVLNRQAARSIHFISFCWFVLFILAHGIMVFVTGLAGEHEPHVRWGGEPRMGWFSAFRPGHGAGGAGLVGRFAFHDPACPSGAADRTIHGRLDQGSRPSGGTPNAQLTETGHLAAFLAERHDAELRGVRGAGRRTSLRSTAFGSVDWWSRRAISRFADLKALPKQEQITTHFCIQGWSGVAKWGGVPMRDILDIVKPTPDARYAVFYSFAEGSDGGRYYDVHEMHNMRHRLTILAYEMNGAPVSVLHGAPLRLRCENELGFKMVKWIAAIEFVRDFADLGAGQGGYNEDHEFYGYRMPI